MQWVREKVGPCSAQWVFHLSSFVVPIPLSFICSIPPPASATCLKAKCQATNLSFLQILTQSHSISGLPVLICHFAISCLIGNRLANVTATWVHRQGGEMDFPLFFHVFLQRDLTQLGVQLQLIFCGKYLIWFLPIFRRQKYCSQLFTNDYWWT